MEKDRDTQRGKMVVLTHVVPRSHTGNAGQNYQSARVQRWMRDWDVRCLLVPGLSSRNELDEAICPTHVLRRAPRGKVLDRVSRRVRRTFPGVADPALTKDLTADAVAAQWLSEADVVVLEWQEAAGQARAIRRMAPKTQIISVLHDVVSQSIARKLALASTRQKRLKGRLTECVARLAESWIMHTSDSVIVLSDKDRHLLPNGPAHVAVVPPSVTAPTAPARAPEPSRIIIVASWRQEDLVSLRWFLDRVLPLVNAPTEASGVHAIGRMAEEFHSMWQNDPVTLDGFVPSIADEYEKAAAAIVPLQLGAGVKFKTVEAVLHRVPVVTTSVGAEGIIGLEGTNLVTDSPEAFANRLTWILSNPEAAQTEADELAQTVGKNHSLTAFREALGRVPLRAPRPAESTEGQ